MTSKLSVLFFYLRVFTSNGMRRATTWMMILTVVWGVANLLQSLFVCRVHHGRLEFTNKSQCNDELPSFIASGLFNGMTNLIITFLPLYTIWSLTVTVSTRMGLTTVFLLGLKYVVKYFLILLSLPLQTRYRSADICMARQNADHVSQRNLGIYSEDRVARSDDRLKRSICMSTTRAQPKHVSLITRTNTCISFTESNRPDHLLVRTGSQPQHPL